MASAGLYFKHATDHPLLKSFAHYLEVDLENENFTQEVRTWTIQLEHYTDTLIRISLEWLFDLMMCFLVLQVENVARFMYFMDPKQPSLLFVRQQERTREYFNTLSEVGLSKQTVHNYIKSVKR